MGRVLLLAWVAGLFLAACDPGRGERLSDGPQLLQDVTLVPTTPAPTRVLSPTPSPIIIPVSTLERTSPFQAITPAADFLLVTPTLPPSKTPTLTPTQTATFTRTPPVTPTTGFIVVPPQPTISGIVPIPTAITNVQAPVAPAASCSTAWFFLEPRPPNCPLNPPLVSDGAFLQFQKGYMLWVQRQDAIYVLYDSANYPRWQVFNDTFEEGMPDTDPAYNSPPPYTWQPRRGFGLLWRTQADVRDRLGWAVIEWETPFETQVQIGDDGTIYINEPRGGVFSLTPDGSEWKRYE